MSQNKHDAITALVDHFNEGTITPSELVAELIRVEAGDYMPCDCLLCRQDEDIYCSTCGLPSPDDGEGRSLCHNAPLGRGAH